MDFPIQLIPVPWEVTVSHGSGTSEGPALIRDSFKKLKLHDLEFGGISNNLVAWGGTPPELINLNAQLKSLFQQIQHAPDNELGLKTALDSINEGCEKMNDWVYQSTRAALRDGKFVGIIGGDHSVAYGTIQALSEKYKGDFGVLQIDAHPDLLPSTGRLRWSHASIMYNIMKMPQPPKKLVQVGIRDIHENEIAEFKNAGARTFFDFSMRERQADGESWKSICEEIVAELPKQVYISFDIDGMEPSLCIGTGTPSPGGLSFNETLILLKTLAKSGRNIIGFDLCEVSDGNLPFPWNGEVGARILGKLCGWAAFSIDRSLR